MELKNTFVLGKMNKDLDERLLPKGEYPHAENIRVSNTDSSDIGAIENVYGNTVLTDFTLTNAKTIGVYSDDSNQKLYWFTTSDEKDLVVEYDVVNTITTVVLESTKPNSVLNFDKNFLITGVVKIINGDSGKDLLAWTDDLNQPRIINIERSKTYGVDGFIEDDISLIKKPPRRAPEADLTFTSTTLENNLEDKFLSFSYRYVYLDGERSALSSFTNYTFSPNEFDLDYQTMENEGMVNSFNAVNLKFDTGSKRVKIVELVFKESNSNSIQLIESFNKEEEGWGDNEEQSFLFSNSKKYASLPEAELFRTYDNVPRLAKALEIIGTRLVLGNYVEQYDLTNIYGEPVNIDFDLSLISKDLLGVQLPIMFSKDDVYNDLMTFDIGTNNLKRDTRLTLDFVISEVTSNDGLYEKSFDFILNRDYVDMNDLATDPEFVLFISDIVSNNFAANYTATPPPDSIIDSIGEFEIVSSTVTSITIKTPTIVYIIDDTPMDSGDNPANTHTEESRWEYSLNTEVAFKEIAVDSSLKTNRSYEVGIIYLDEYNRATTVLTEPENTIYIPQEFSTSQNKIQASINHLPPAWADRYKFVVKQNKGDYHTIYTNIFYVDGVFRWVKIEGANKDKVKEGDTLIVKSDLGGVLSNIVKVRVLEKEYKEKDFIEDNEDTEGNDIIEESGTYIKIKPVGFDMNTTSTTFREFSGGSHLRYPIRTYTSGEFGTYDDTGTIFTPYKLPAGSTVRIRIKFSASGKIAYEALYDKRFRVNGDYDSIKDWFDIEVGDLGSFGRDYTWDGDSSIGSNMCGGHGLADSNNRFSGWGFGKHCQEPTNIIDETPERFYVAPHRKGTASRNIGVSVKFEVRFSDGSVIFETEAEDLSSDIYYETEQAFDVVDGFHTGNISDQTAGTNAVSELDAFNCYVQGNGAESYRYKDAFNTKALNIDLRPTSTSIEEYKEVRRFADLTYSSVYSENSNLNGLNEFNLATANYKEDIDKKYGFIQKLYSRDTDLIVFQEDKVSKVLFGKDLLMNADGSSNITSLESVLGQQIAFSGEFGISRNPESFSYDAYNMYFTDSKRGSVLRLGRDGITEISSLGLRSWYKDVFKGSIDTKKTAAFDPYYDQYVLHPSDELLVKPDSLNCGESLIRSGFSGELKVDLNFGILIGDSGFSYTSNGIPVRYILEWNGNTYDTGFVGDSSYDSELISLGHNATVGLGDGSLVFNKDESSPTEAFLTVIAPICDSSFTISTNCVVPEELNVVSIILNNETDEGKEITNRYNWGNNTYNSPFKSYTLDFLSDEVTLFDSVSGDSGSGFIPLEDSTITMESYKGFGQSGTFEECDKLGYLISSTVYTEADIDTIRSLATFPSITNTVSNSGEIINKIDFDFERPLGENYLYLIWDYFDTKPVAVDDYTSVRKGESRNLDVRLNDTDPNGLPLTVILGVPPNNGSVVVELDGTVTYTHDDSETLSDLFTYSVTNGNCTSYEATVFIDIAVSCEDGFAHSGAAGSFSFEISFGTAIGMAGIQYDAFNVPDQFEIFWDGNLVADTGLVSGDGQLLFNKTTSTPTTATVVVTAPLAHTAWNISGICPI